MANVERGVVRGPNQVSPGNRVDSSSPLGHGAPYSDVPNNKTKSARVNSCGPMGKSGGAVKGPNDNAKFNIANARIGYDGDTGVDAPGKGLIPVEPANPFTNQTFVPAHMLRDSAKK